MSDVGQLFEQSALYEVPDGEIGFLGSEKATDFVATSQEGIKIGPVLKTARSRTVLIELETGSIFGALTNGEAQLVGHIMKGPVAASKGLSVAIGETFVSRLCTESTFHVRPFEVFAVRNGSDTDCILSLTEVAG